MFFGVWVFVVLIGGDCVGLVFYRLVLVLVLVSEFSGCGVGFWGWRDRLGSLVG